MDIASATAAASVPQSQSTRSSIGLGNDLSTFLTLLTTQLQNQDPTQPLDTAEFTNQLVLFTQAEQQIRTNSSLETLVALNRGTIGTQALGYIDKEVSFVGNSLFLPTDGTAQKFTYSLASDAGSLALSIKDSTGKTVRTFNDPALTAGNHTVMWDGKNNDGALLPSGVYTVTATAINDKGAPIRSSTLVNARVTGLSSDGQGSVNLTVDGDRTVDLSAIQSVRTLDRSINSTQQSS